MRPLRTGRRSRAALRPKFWKSRLSCFRVCDSREWIERDAKRGGERWRGGGLGELGRSDAAAARARVGAAISANWVASTPRPRRGSSAAGTRGRSTP